MTISCWFICVFVVLKNEVYLQDTVGFVGDSVVLPCSSTKHDVKLQDTDVHWKDKHDKTVHSIIKGEGKIEEQDQRYKNRVETFPAEYLRRNFSIKLNNLTHADAGKYTCFITPSDERKTTQLIIKEPISETEHKASDQENQAVDSGADSEWKSGLLLWFSRNYAADLQLSQDMKTIQNLILSYEDITGSSVRLDSYTHFRLHICSADKQSLSAGKYTCFITPSDEEKTVQLIINGFQETTTVGRNNITEQENKEETRPVWKSGLLILVGILSIILLMSFTVIHFRKKIMRL
ncbi:hypothetical protein Q8A67_006120 [Cirrhinus molitorella]|uniref:Ig-like domain-containing protein n=1 Tax=Cirrhinus molitorella TaxID=172907 RepID=A0AA88TW09_9TELE|nr:hypothetical protein Q8A67_006120 [Cirrhinus molitorella]